MLTSDLISQAERRLYSGKRVSQNKLVSAYTAGQTTLSFTYDLDEIKEGSYIAIDLEVFYVWSTNESAKTATVEIAQLGSTNANHANGSIAYVNPLYPKWDIFSAINDDIESLSGEGLYQMKTVNLTFNSAYQGYDLTGVTDILDIYEIKYEQAGSNRYWPTLSSYSLTRNMDTSKFASGLALLTFSSASQGLPLRVKYKAPFVPLTSLTDNVETVSGLTTSQTKIPVIGACAQLLSGRESKRAQFEHQGDSRRAEEVPPGSQSRATQDLLRLRQTWVNAELTKLTQQFPPRL